ncbi:valine--tRNA ligase [Candidatus Kaiserbacteria bacterium]|nr:valine--tRNA ligase [Candidatus Kaiserbacteria bacterium]
MDPIFLKPYDPKAHEDTIYKRWEESGFFNPDNLPPLKKRKKREPYSIVLPPPNVTGTLHMGHAAMLAIQDILIRFNRMRGKKTLWLPGVDHAAIATQSKVESDIYKKEKKTRHDLGREVFLKRVEEFAKESHDTIVNQIKKMGSSVDWSREAFTLDEVRTKAVYTAFKQMYEDGLIYRSARVCNWDPKGQTTVSDDETEREEREAMLYTFRYDKDFPIAISTTRPETKLGDTGVAVHPSDTRYAKYVGKTFDASFMGEKLSIKVVADKEVDMEFGTGAVGVTPAHSFTDWDIATRHDLPLKQVINEYAQMTAGNDSVKGKKVKVARNIIVEELRKAGLIEKEEKVMQSVLIAERTGGVIEPLPKLQWWIDTEKEFKLKHSRINGIKSGSTVTLKRLMKHVVEKGHISILPERFTKIYYHWIDNLRPWCISRQIWYGHRIPIWYHEPRCVPIPGREEEVSECEMTVLSETQPKCAHCNAIYIQDTDTLDTWFSSGLWTFSTLGWPEKTNDLKTYHPTDVLETGYDILFFWVARMILMSGYLLGDIPFRTVYLHGLVRDEKGRKMSKSLGNIIDPLDMIEKYGGDATRLSLIIGAAAGNDLRLSEEKIRGYKHFVNKLWNIARFILENYNEDALDARFNDTDQKFMDKEVQTAVERVTKNIESFRLDLAADEVYHFVWDKFAAVEIEFTKSALKNPGTKDWARKSAQRKLYDTLVVSLKLLHPFMPFVTETIWSYLPQKEKTLLMVEEWPA